MLYYDYYFTIGKTHDVCEDYVTQGHLPAPFIVLSDGCTASLDTDIGARILALTTKHIIENSPEWPLDYLNFGRKLIAQAFDVTVKMKLKPSVLDATVVLGFLHEDAIQVYVYGDGAILFKDFAGRVSTIDISFIHNAPYYLTYWQDELRQKEYAQYESRPLLLTDSINGQSDPLPFQTPLLFSFPLQQFPTVAIASDGITQCIDMTQSVRLSLDEISTELLNFKHLQGEFVKHRTRRVLQQYAQQGIFPADDLSIGAFVQMKEGEE